MMDKFPVLVPKRNKGKDSTTQARDPKTLTITWVLNFHGWAQFNIHVKLIQKESDLTAP